MLAILTYPSMKWTPHRRKLEFDFSESSRAHWTRRMRLKMVREAFCGLSSTMPLHNRIRRIYDGVWRSFQGHFFDMVLLSNPIPLNFLYRIPVFWTCTWFISFPPPPPREFKRPTKGVWTFLPTLADFSSQVRTILLRLVMMTSAIPNSLVHVSL